MTNEEWINRYVGIDSWRKYAKIEVTGVGPDTKYTLYVRSVLGDDNWLPLTSINGNRPLGEIKTCFIGYIKGLAEVYDEMMADLFSDRSDKKVLDFRAKDRV